MVNLVSRRSLIGSVVGGSVFLAGCMSESEEEEEVELVVFEGLTRIGGCNALSDGDGCNLWVQLQESAVESQLFDEIRVTWESENRLWHVEEYDEQLYGFEMERSFGQSDFMFTAVKDDEVIERVEREDMPTLD